MMYPNAEERTTTHVRLWADTVAKVENRTMPKISRKSIFRRFYPCRADTKVPDRICMKRRGPSHGRARNASAVFKIFVLRKKGLFQHYRAQSGQKANTF
jgi:hypothetical protein